MNCHDQTDTILETSGASRAEPMLATFFYGDNAVKFSGDDKKELRKKEAIAGAQRLVGSDPTSPDERSFHPLSVV